MVRATGQRQRLRRLHRGHTMFLQAAPMLRDHTPHGFPRTEDVPVRWQPGTPGPLQGQPHPGAHERFVLRQQDLVEEATSSRIGGIQHTQGHFQVAEQREVRAESRVQHQVGSRARQGGRDEDVVEGGLRHPP